MKHLLYQVDAFTNTIFGGNPASVVPLENWLPDNLLLKIAKVNAVAATVFYVDKGEKINGVGYNGVIIPVEFPYCIIRCANLWIIAHPNVQTQK
jgi:hypothetical protein